MSAILEQYKTKLLIAEQDKVHSKREYMNGIEELKVVFEKQMKCRSAEIEECRGELQQAKEKFQRKVERDKLEKGRKSTNVKGKVTDKLGSSWYGDTTKFKYHQGFSLDKPGDSTKTAAIKGKMPTCRKVKDDSSSKEIKSNQRSLPAPPKPAISDGKSEWKPYFMQFNHIAKNMNVLKNKN
ncbi:unnamed protein product [Mytilus coruscus]|uniref:Uncharacterized protein n=1 Tax=Mytilus coruscus TaxID=42192 RepID=A0A6J8B0E9_MYTCO|nr:unnamed protein product [Mytilus coruscus]